MTKEELAAIKKELLKERESKKTEYIRQTKRIFFDEDGKELYFNDINEMMDKAKEVYGDKYQAMSWFSNAIYYKWIDRDDDVEIYYLTEKFSKEEKV